ncbi:methyl-accepting chemotaxis protein [Deinococcus radiotolerans]|uniref:Methyl-accepting chemotaxis protein n=1 Tax=Deinococcus radiotolerans TaxID=1309407 RepID=A0ABQ2FN33_9DEIO|nr:methyl-accepting chemotaxis protein [Deinococcus radiotolerans]GGL10288.1 methyl-accepting chemotaxis protein [Deinococcus radiotolerans]
MQLQFQTARLNRANRKTNAQRVGWLGQLRVGQKLSLAAFAFAVPLTVLVSTLLVEQQSAITKTKLELSGIEQFGPLRDINTNLAGFVSTALRGDSGGAAKAASAMDGAIDRLEAQVSPEYRERVQSLRRDWKTLPDSIGTQPDLAILQTYAQLLSTYQRDLSEDLLTQSGLMLDPVPNTFHTMEATLRILPRLSTGLNLAALTTEAGRREPGDDSSYLSVLRDLNVTLQDALTAYNASVDRVVRADPKAGAALSEAATKLNEAVTPALADLGAAVEGGSLNSVDVQGIQNSALLQVGAAYNSGVETLTRDLQSRMSDTERQRLLSLLAIIAALVLAFTLLIRLSRAIVKPLTELTRASRAVSSGDLNVQVPVQTRDELGYMAHTFNNATTQLRVNEEKNLNEREEAAKLQNNIGSFLDVTMDIAGGDLTRRGVVSEDVLGNVVDSINLMVDELGQVLGEVQKASVSVTDASRDMLRTTDQIVQGADTTTQETRRVAAQVRAVTDGFRDMAEAAQLSAESARQALEASEQGREAVLGTLDGMQNIRREVQGVARRIKTLGERSLEIQEIVDTISRLSSQTNLLALNASIEAAGAGAAGSRFAIVADEVRKLADSSAQATARIASLIRTVQLEITEVVGSVEDNTREVEQGYRVAAIAGERIEQLGKLAAESAQFAERINAATTDQVRSVEQVSEAVQQIGQVAENSNESVEQGRAAARRLQHLAQNLLQSLSRFKLPTN